MALDRHQILDPCGFKSPQNQNSQDYNHNVFSHVCSLVNDQVLRPGGSQSDVQRGRATFALWDRDRNLKNWSEV